MRTFAEVWCVWKLFSPCLKPFSQAEHKVSLFASARFLNRKKWKWWCQHGSNSSSLVFELGRKVVKQVVFLFQNGMFKCSNSNSQTPPSPLKKTKNTRNHHPNFHIACCFGRLPPTTIFPRRSSGRRSVCGVQLWRVPHDVSKNIDRLCWQRWNDVV